MGLKDKIEICFPESKDDLDLLSLPFKSTYRVLSWQGVASGVLLTPNFNIADIEGKLLIIKSFRIVPYYGPGSPIDIVLRDGITTTTETVFGDTRIDRLFDVDTGTVINLRINGGPVNLFNAVFPLDVDLQNIYFKYPEKIQELTLRITSTYIFNLEVLDIRNPTLIVNMEVYLI